VTVRSWITISVLVLVALAGATVYQFTRPLEPPAILVHAGSKQLDGSPTYTSCWPQRNGKLRCTGEDPVANGQTIGRSGSFRFVVAYPIQPDEGSIRIYRDRKTVLKRSWKRSLRYKLEPGSYVMTVRAEYPARAVTAYAYSFTVR
jgi:hypothetical protein